MGGEGLGVPPLWKLLDGPRVHDDGVGLLVEKDAVEDVEGVDGNDSRDEGFLGLAVEGLGGEAAGVDFAAFFHEFGETLVHEEVAGEGFFAEGGESALETHGDAGSVEENGGLVAFSQQAGGGEGVDDGDGSFESDGVKGDESLVALVGLHVFKDFFFVIDEEVPVLVHWLIDFRHLFFGWYLLVRLGSGLRTAWQRRESNDWAKALFWRRIWAGDLCTSLRTETAFPLDVKNRVTMAEVAKAVGVSASTVSRALRNDLRISAMVREAVREKAEELGYRPSPMLSALMANRGRGSEGGAGLETLALVTDYGGGVRWQEKDVCRWEFEGMSRRAGELGFALEEFPVSEHGGDIARVEAVLEARGIRGVILGFSRSRSRRVLLQGGSFVVVGLSAYFREAAVDRANFHGFHNVRLALNEMRKLGYRRTGLVVPELNNRLSGYQWTSGALEWQRNLSQGDCCPPFVPDGEGAERAFRDWLRREEPDSLLVYKLPVKSWLAKLSLRIPQDIGVALLFRTEDERESSAGIDGHLEMVGAAAVDLVVEGLSSSRMGMPEHPKEVLIKGSWVVGESLVGG